MLKNSLILESFIEELLKSISVPFLDVEIVENFVVLVEKLQLGCHTSNVFDLQVVVLLREISSNECWIDDKERRGKKVRLEKTVQEDRERELTFDLWEVGNVAFTVFQSCISEFLYENSRI